MPARPRILGTQPTGLGNVQGGGGGNIPPGAAVMTDSISLFAAVSLDDQIATPADVGSFALRATYPDSVPGALDAISVNPRLADMVGGQGEAVRFTVGNTDQLAAQAEAFALRLSGFTDTNTAPVDALTAGVRGLGDTSAAQSEQRDTTVTTWGGAVSGSGTAPTNQPNATGQNNGTVATVKAGGVANGTSSLFVSVPRASVPTPGAKSIVAYYATNPGSTDTFTLRYEHAGASVPTPIVLPAGNFLTVPFTAALTSFVPGASDPLFTFTHAATVPASGGSITVDAVGIRTLNPF